MTTPFTSALTIAPLAAFWDRPPSKDRGDGPEDLIYQQVGMALTVWEGVEQGMAQLFSVLLQAEYQVAGRAYGVITNGNTRREMLGAAWEVQCARKQISDEDRAVWGLLMEHYKGGGAKRNEIAHGTVSRFVVAGDDRGLFLAPSLYNTKKITLGPQRKTELDVFGHQYRYTAGDILHFTEKFNEVRGWAVQFVGVYVERHGQS